MSDIFFVGFFVTPPFMFLGFVFAIMDPHSQLGPGFILFGLLVFVFTLFLGKKAADKEDQEFKDEIDKNQ